MDYKTSGVDVTAGRNFVSQIKSSVEETHSEEVIGGLGGFGGMIRFPKGMEKPVLVSGTDGVGTKLELAQDYQLHFGVGLDLVAMCVNDVITTGAKPLFFLDYIATGKLSPIAMKEVIDGIATGCKRSGCSLLGGETAEMPGFYPSGRYDLAGFSVGVVEEDEIIDGKNINPGDQIIAVSSSGFHSNGFSLIRKVLEIASVNKDTRFGPKKLPLINALLEPTNLYVDLVQNLLKEQIPIKGMAHITGGGLPENLPRCVPKGLNPFIDVQSWEKPEIFRWIQSTGDIPEVDLWNTFNLGVGYCFILSKEAANAALSICNENGFDSWVIGSVKESKITKSDEILGLPF